MIFPQFKIVKIKGINLEDIKPLIEIQNAEFH